MIKNEFLNIARGYYRQHGFQILKKNKFFFDSDELTLCVYISRSNFSELYYTDYFIRLKSLHSEILRLTDDIWDVNGRLSYDNIQLFTVEPSLWSEENYLKTLDDLSTKQISPIISKGVEYVKKLVEDCTPGVIVYGKDTKNKILTL